MSKAADTHLECVISTYCSSATKMVTPTCLIIKFIHTLIVFLSLKKFIVFSNNPVNYRCLSNVSEYSMSFMNQITI